VETSDEDSFVAVAQFVADQLNGGPDAPPGGAGSRFYADCESLMAGGRLADVVARFVGQVDLLFGKCAAEDSRCCINVICHLVPRLEDGKVLPTVTALAKALASKADERAEERLAALVNLYNVCPTAASQHAVLATALEYARGGGRALAAALLPAVRGRAEQWVRAWKLPDAQARELFIACAALFAAVGTKPAAVEAARLVTSALSLVRADDAAGLAAVKAHAVGAVTAFVASADTYICDFADLPAVAQLASDAAHAPLHRLMRALLSGDLQAYKVAATPAVLTAVGLSPEAGLAKARMMVLLALAARAGHEDIPFGAIQAALDVPADAVETHVIRAVGSRLLEAKIDQIGGAVRVTNHLQSSFAAADWKAVQSRLAAYRAGLAQVAELAAAHQRALHA